MAGSEAKARAAAVTQKGLFPYHQQDTVNVFPAPTPWRTRRELDPAAEKEFENLKLFRNSH